MSRREPKKRLLKGVPANPRRTRKDSDAFWSEIRFQLDIQWREEDMVRVLSPKQARKYELALMGLPKFKEVLRLKEEGHIFYPVPLTAFERRLHEWHIFGLIDLAGLEEKYLKKIQPTWREKPVLWKELLPELKRLAEEQKLTKRFDDLWRLYMQKVTIVEFLDALDPYSGNEKSMLENESRLVERYIYALWMHRAGYIGGRNKTQLGSKLVQRIHDVTSINNGSSIRFRAYKRLVGSTENPLLRSVTDMTPEQITEYATDGILTAEDFPEIFSP